MSIVVRVSYVDCSISFLIVLQRTARPLPVDFDATGIIAIYDASEILQKCYQALRHADHLYGAGS
jgi:hypothetical protein